jgi:elongation factor Ts
MAFSLISKKYISGRSITKLCKPNLSLYSSPVIASYHSSSIVSANPITAALVKELREKSSAPMMECKKALSQPEVDGDIALAMDWLRVKGISRAQSNAERVSTEGLVSVCTTDKCITVLEINSETDFVSRNIDFQKFVSLVTLTINNGNIVGDVNIEELMNTEAYESNGKTIRDSLGDIISMIRENIIIRRATNLIPKEKDVLSAYVHGKIGMENVPANIQMGKTVSIVEMSCSNVNSYEITKEMGKKIAMHVVAANPQYAQADQVPADVVAKETAIFREQTEAMEKKPKPEMIEKIIAGKVNKRLSEICLLSQGHVAEEGQPIISKFIDQFSDKNDTIVKLNSFIKWNLGDLSK